MNTIKNFYINMIRYSGKLCVIGETELKEIKDNVNNKDDKQFITSYKLKQGDVFIYNNINYFVLNREDLSHNEFNLYTVRKCIDYIKFNFSSKDNITGEIKLDIK